MSINVSPACERPVNARIHDARRSNEEHRQRLPLEVIRQGRLVCSEKKLNIGTWNVEHLTPQKVVELQRLMIEKDLDVLCLQETHICGAESYITEEGFLIILSGGPSGVREFAGVGFMVFPTARKLVIFSLSLCKTH